MKFHLAQINVVRFRLPPEDPVNKDFIDSLDRVNTVAETQPGFVWRFTGEGNNALDVQAYEDPNVAVNMSVWKDLDSLGDFVYRNDEHLAIMRRRHEWFDKIEFHLVLWWVAEGETPSIDDAKRRLEALERDGPTEHAFTFRHPYPPPSREKVRAIMDECA